MNNFLSKNKAENVDSMYGKEVYFTLFPNNKDRHFIYSGELLGYGAYGQDPEYKTFCIYVDRGDCYRFVDYFQDGRFVTKEEFEKFKEEEREKEKGCISLGRLMQIAKLEEEHIDVKVKVGGLVYPICGITEQAKTIKVPAFVLKADEESGEKGGY